MKIKFFKKNIVFLAFFVFVVVVGVIYSKDSVDATSKADITNEKIYVCYDKKTGNYKGTKIGSGTYAQCKQEGYSYSSVKMAGDNYAYCVNWKLQFYGGSYNYVVDESWDGKSAHAIKAGYLINLVQNVNEKKYDKNEAYERTGATLNSYFASKVSDSGSYNYSSNSEISKYLSAANAYYSSVKLGKTLPSITITSKNGTVLSYNDSTGKYFSGLITVSGLVATYGGSSDTVSYTITAKTSSGSSVNMCTSSKGTGCNAGEITLSNRSSNYSFYLFVDKSKVSVDDSIIVTVKGNNKSTYFSSILYEDSAHPDAQKLMSIDEFDVSRNTSKSSTFTIPDLTNHRIVAYKVNDNGDLLTGANFKLYRDSVNIDNLLASNKNGSSVLTYVSDKVSENDDDFFKHDYILVEESAPNGYVLSDEKKVNTFYVKGSATGNNVTCYKSSESDDIEKVDNEFCNPDNYKYMCKASTGEVINTDENGNCEFNTIIAPTPSNSEVQTETQEDNSTTSTQGTNSVTDNNTDSEIDNGGGVDIDDDLESDNDVYQPSVVYDTVCYKIDTKTVVSNDYCNSKESYIKVQHASGNITVTHMNSKNVIKVSKKDITGEKEIPGATLKICTKADYDSKKVECSPAKTIDNLEMNWVSGESMHSIYGVPKGDYYIIEVTPPDGYIQATIATPFSINEKGDVVSGDKSITNKEFVEASNSLVVKNKLTKITISKQDMATSKELPGATISICRTYVDENNDIQMLVDQYTGDCIEATLANGEVATWVSTNKSKEISGLPAGTYYLVETKAPKDYSTAESILFTLNSDGTLVDKDGNALSDNKIVMKDELIKNEPTGTLATYVVIGILVGVGALGTGCLIYLKKTGNKKVNK